jgi:hypothetical protein
MNYVFPVRVWVGPTNHDPLVLLDQARRLNDLDGRPGILRKRRQTNERYAQRGYLKFVFERRSQARRFQSRVDEYCAGIVQTKRYRREVN